MFVKIKDVDMVNKSGRLHHLPNIIVDASRKRSNSVLSVDRTLILATQQATNNSSS